MVISILFLEQALKIYVEMPTFPQQNIFHLSVLLPDWFPATDLGPWKEEMIAPVAGSVIPKRGGLMVFLVTSFGSCLAPAFSGHLGE